MRTDTLKKVFTKDSFIYNFMRKAYYDSYELRFHICYFFRRYFPFSKSKYSLIKNYKDIHKGKRCFIVATGPSLTNEDLEMLKGEYTFGMNSIVMAYDQLNWRPTYYGIQDYSVYEKIENYIDFNEHQANFVSGFLQNKIKQENVTLFPLTLMGHPTQRNDNYHTKFTDDCYLKVYDGFSITYSLLQIAVYMGFTEIYLLGADSTYKSEKKHFRDYESSDPTRSTITERLFMAYGVARKYCEKNGVKVYNATRGGVLEVFERVDFDSLFNKKNQ